MYVGVLAAHLADLRAHGHRHAVGLAIPDEFRELGGTLVIDALLRVERLLGEVHQRGGVDIDVVEAGLQLLFHEQPHGLQLGIGVGGVLLGIHLNVVALDEQRPGEALAQCGSRHHGNILGGPLVGVSDLRAGDLADHRAHVEPFGGAEYGAPRVVGKHADVDRRGSERPHRAAPAREVQLVDRRGPHSRLLPDLPDQPPGLVALVRRAEHGLAHQLVQRGALAYGRALKSL